MYCIYKIIDIIIGDFLCKEEDFIVFDLDRHSYHIELKYLSIEGLERCLSWMKIYYSQVVISKTGKCKVKLNKYNWIRISSTNEDNKYLMQFPVIADAIKQRIVEIYEDKKKEWINNV